MNICYSDIIDVMGAPVWWDEKAVPRYCEFHPKHCDIYSKRVIFMEIACQACDARFKVAMSVSIVDEIFDRDWAFEKGSPPPHYGDPPNTGCCDAGATMNSEHIQVLEYWERDQEGIGWVKIDLSKNPVSSL